MKSIVEMRYPLEKLEEVNEWLKTKPEFVKILNW